MPTDIMSQAEREVIQFLAGQPTPQEIVDFKLSEPAAERFCVLLEAKRTRPLADDEQEEAETYLNMDHFMRLMKAEAHLRLNQRAS
ncbi:MAG TPA: hypothetical protein VJN88_15165 [Ktedonobacterales bacterium]|nr:hypothetical protein [Ktedonobacterales bacterium]